MLVNHQKKFIFIHINKTGGSSVRKVFKKQRPWYKLSPKKLTKISEFFGISQKPEWIQYPPHLTANEARDIFPEEVWNSYFKFAFVRNPWDWLVSLYHFRLIAKHPKHELFQQMGFSNFVGWWIENDLFLQRDFICDKDGNLSVDFIGRFETIEEDFKFICRKISMSELSLPHTNKSPRTHYSYYYDDQTRDLLALALKPDIELFKYTFERMEEPSHSGS